MSKERADEIYREKLAAVADGEGSRLARSAITETYSSLIGCIEGGGYSEAAIAEMLDAFAGLDVEVLREPPVEAVQEVVQVDPARRGPAGAFKD